MRLETQRPSYFRYAAAVAALSPLLLPFASIMAADVAAPPVNLAWNTNPESDIAGYKVYFGTESGNYSQIIDAPGRTSAALPQLVIGGTYYLAVSAYNSAGLEGPRSSELVLSATPPAATESTSFTMAPAGSGTTGTLAWKYPKVTTSAAQGFAVYGSEDLVNWNVVQNITPDQASRSDEQYLYFEWPYAATAARMFFRVGAGNAFGETK